MNSYDRIYSLLLEEDFLLEQRRALTSKQKLGITTGLLGALAGGVSQVGNTGMPSAHAAPSVTRTVSSKRTAPELPSITRSSEREVGVTPSPEKGSDQTLVTPKPRKKRSGPVVLKRQGFYGLNLPVKPGESDMNAKEKAANLQRSIDQEQNRIDFYRRQGRREL